MKWTKRLIGGLFTAGFLYLILVFVGGMIFAGLLERHVKKTLQERFAGEVTIADSSFHLWDGTVTLSNVRVIRKDGADLTLEIPSLKAKMAGWGGMLFDRSIHSCDITGGNLDLSAHGAIALALRPKHPLLIRDLRITDAHVRVSPSLLFMGLGQLDLIITQARATNVEVTDGLSWLWGTTQLHAKAEAPGGFGGTIKLDGHELTVSGEWLATSGEFTMPFQMPHLPSGASEVDRLKALGKEAVRGISKKLIDQGVSEAASTIGKWLD